MRDCPGRHLLIRHWSVPPDYSRLCIAPSGLLAHGRMRRRLTPPMRPVARLRWISLPSLLSDLRLKCRR